MATSLKQHRVPYFKPSIGAAEIQSVVETLKSGWLTTGPKTKQFERDFADKVGAPHAIAVSSATAALTLALEAIGVGPGDEVLVPSLTFASTGEVVVHLGGRPVLVDCRHDTLNIDPDQIEQHITGRTKAIIPVHYGGQPCDMEAIHRIADEHGLRVIEDAAHALPAVYRGRTVGTISDITCFSFYANKTITTGEGGMITTGNDDLAARMRIMSLHGISKDAWKRFSAEGSWYYEITAPGYKFNMTDIAAALGIHQLVRCDEFFEARLRIAERYSNAFTDAAELETPTVVDDVQMAWHLFVLRLHLDRLTIDRNEFIRQLSEAGVGTSVHYLPLHMHPLYRNRWNYQPGDAPAANAEYQRMFSLPIYPRMSAVDVEYVIETVRRIATYNRA